jgi:hypothetical protein
LGWLLGVYSEDLAVALREGRCISLSWSGAYRGIWPFGFGEFRGEFGLGFALKTHCIEWSRAYLIEDCASNICRWARWLLDHRVR